MERIIRRKPPHPAIRIREQVVFHLRKTAGKVPPPPHRSDNCVKNRFYSKLRKSTRRINKFITDQLNSQYEEITPRLLSNLIETSELRFHPNAKVNEETIELSVCIFHPTQPSRTDCTASKKTSPKSSRKSNRSTQSEN
jgi:hypothetical protein